MSKLLKSKSINHLFLLAILLSACSKGTVNKDISSFKFNDIYVEQVDKNGIKQFTFKTKKAKINELDKSIKAKDSLVIFYQGNKPTYKLTSNSSNLTGNGEKILLDSGIEMISLLNNDFSVKAESIIWIKELAQATVEGNIIVNIKGSSFLAKKAIYNHKKNLVKFIGIDEYNYYNFNNKAKISILAENALWNGDINTLTFTNNDSKVLTKIFIYN